MVRLPLELFVLSLINATKSYLFHVLSVSTCIESFSSRVIFFSKRNAKGMDEENPMGTNPIVEF